MQRSEGRCPEEFVTDKATTVENGLFLFHRDLRIVDNRGLIEASRQCKHLYTCFIFTPEQVGTTNKYRSEASVLFMVESLQSLEADLHQAGGKLLLFYGDTKQVVEKVIKQLSIQALFFNRDYSPYARRRDAGLHTLCAKHHVDCRTFSDYYLYEPGTILTGDAAYKKYTPFYQRVLHEKVDPVDRRAVRNLKRAHVAGAIDAVADAVKRVLTQTTPNPQRLVQGGRALALLRLRLATRKQRQYDDQRDFFTTETTLLSAYIKFGCVSIREVYHTFVSALGRKTGLIRELIWRDFFAHVLYHYPEVVGQSYQSKYRKLEWKNDRGSFRKWCEGRTGFPLVDACMRQLNTTGYMHNRGRMVVASFLIKTLLIDWRWGERYFAQHLADYDIASNNGNWQGISGTGVDMKPYFRDMNPWIQSNQFDPEAEFIQTWVPELKDVPPRDIHRWYEAHKDYPKVYLTPMADYHVQKEAMLHMYKSAS